MAFIGLGTESNVKGERLHVDILYYLWWTFMIESGLILLRWLCMCFQNGYKQLKKNVVPEHSMATDTLMYILPSSAHNSIKICCVLWRWWHTSCERYDIIIRAYAWVKLLMGVIILESRMCIFICFYFFPSGYYSAFTLIGCHGLNTWNSRINILWFPSNCINSWCVY